MNKRISDMEQKFKVGDRVRVKSRQWYLNNRDCYGYIKLPNSGKFEFSPSKAAYCGYIFEIARIFKGKDRVMVYAFNYVDGYFTEDMFDAVPNDAPLTITSENYFGAIRAIEQNAKWFKQIPLPPKCEDISNEQRMFEWYQAVDNIADDIIMGEYDGKFNNARPIRVIRPHELDDTCLDGIGYHQIPDYGISHGCDEKWIAAIYIIEWCCEGTDNHYSVLSIHSPRSRHGDKCSIIHEHKLGAIASNFWQGVHNASYFAKVWFTSSNFDNNGVRLLEKGQKVRIKTRDWYDLLKNEYGVITMPNSKGQFSEFMAEYCGQILEVRDQRSKETFELGNTGFVWPKWCFEVVTEKEKSSEQKQATKAVIANAPRGPMTYLMRDDNHGYTKIGKSVNPRKRERTLLADAPIITLFAVCERDVEKELHALYAGKNKRGEWFDLSDVDIAEICEKYNFKEVNNA